MNHTMRWTTCGCGYRWQFLAAGLMLIDASFTVTSAMGQPKRPDKRDQNQLVLEWDGRRWLFLSGM